MIFLFKGVQCIAQKEPMLTQRHINLRLALTIEHSSWTWVDWSEDMWTKESRFTTFRVMYQPLLGGALVSSLEMIVWCQLSNLFINNYGHEQW